MKNFTTILVAALFASFFLGSCGQKRAKDIDISKLNTPCECVEAGIIVAKEGIDILKKTERILDEAIKSGGAGNQESLQKRLMDIMEQSVNFQNIAYEISKICGEKFEDEETEKCPDFEKLKELQIKLEKLSAEISEKTPWGL